MRLLLTLSVLKLGLILDYPHPVMPFKTDTVIMVVSVLKILKFFLNLEDDSNQRECLKFVLHPFDCGHTCDRSVQN